MCYVVADGKSNWLEGVILMCKLTSSVCKSSPAEIRTHVGLYIVIAVTFWFYPGKLSLERGVIRRVSNVLPSRVQLLFQPGGVHDHPVLLSRMRPS